MKQLFVTILALMLLALNSQAQQLLFDHYQAVPVTMAGKNLKLPWAGGLQSPQFSHLDLNNNGIKDLVVFDRTDNTVSTFLNSGQPGDTAYTYAPEYEVFFPTDLFNWMLLADYNCDGKEDIFTGNNSHVKVYRNISTGNTPAFQLVTASLQAGSGPIQFPFTDIPALADVDNDGDLDLLGFTLNSDFVTLFRNRRIEDNLPCESLNFSVQTNCWGNFEEDFFTSAITLNVPCGNRQGQLPQQGSKMHSGSSLLVFDANGDGDKDALIGDIAGETLVFLQNGGTPGVANMVSQTTSYPSSQPVNIYSFPAAYYLDVDNDSKKDLVVAPNSGAESGFKNFNQVLFYKNTGTNTSPAFSFTKTDFLGGQMIEAGAGAAPTFTDYDQDGKTDLVLGNFSYLSSAGSIQGKLTLFRNTGTNASPAYTFISDDFGGLSAQNLLSLAPAFGDLDGDGDMDMLVGEQQGRIFFFRNVAPAGQPSQFTLISNNFLNQTLSGAAVPHIADIDRDGKPDLLVGERNGNISYYRNTGTTTNPVFTLVTATFGNISVRDPLFAAGYAAPFITDLNSNNNYELLVGDIQGNIHIYTDIETNLAGTFTEIGAGVNNSLIANVQPLKLGRRVIPAAQDVTGDGKPDLLAGIYRGGVRLFRNTGIITGLASASEKEAFTIYPNPFTNEVAGTLPAGSSGSWQLTCTNTLGQVVYQAGHKPENPAEKGDFRISLEHLPAGIYLLSASDNQQLTFIRKIIKLQ